ncbi:MAG: HNH endonuclease [Pseudonocardiaceae bacterium]
MLDRQPIPIGAPAPGMGGETSEIVLPTQLGGAIEYARAARRSRVPRGHGRRRQRDYGVGPPSSRSRVLLLNATFEPLTALSLRRAVVLIVCDKAEVVHGDPSGLILHSATVAVPVPSVIRLSTYVRVPYRAKVPLTRAGLMHRDRYRCAYCGGRAETVDHVVPRSRGGAHSWQNCVACCARCNHRKADRLLSELGWSLRTDPQAPHGPHWRLLAQVNDADEEWRQYLGAPAA